VPLQTWVGDGHAPASAAQEHAAAPAAGQTLVEVAQ
jgi:hypothetical protein